MAETDRDWEDLAAAWRATRLPEAEHGLGFSSSSDAEPDAAERRRLRRLSRLRAPWPHEARRQRSARCMAKLYAANASPSKVGPDREVARGAAAPDRASCPRFRPDKALAGPASPGHQGLLAIASTQSPFSPERNPLSLLLTEVLRDRGFPVDDFTERHDEISVVHPQIAADYRKANAIAERKSQGQAPRERQTQDVMH